MASTAPISEGLGIRPIISSTCSVEWTLFGIMGFAPRWAVPSRKRKAADARRIPLNQTRAGSPATMRSHPIGHAVWRGQWIPAFAGMTVLLLLQSNTPPRHSRESARVCTHLPSRLIGDPIRPRQPPPISRRTASRSPWSFPRKRESILPSAFEKVSGCRRDSGLAGNRPAESDSSCGVERPIDSRFRGHECVREDALSAWWKSTRCGVTTHVAESNCVAARRGGKQLEAKGQPVG